MRKKVIIVAILSIIYIIGFPVFKEYVLDAPYSFVIETTGEKNESSGGTEIWIDGIKKDGENVNLNTLKLGENWENRGRIFNSGEKSSSWKLCVRSKKATVITFVTHPYSGIVKITDSKGNTKAIDLYSPREEIYSYTVNEN